ncbi:hypothetical protein EHZ47_08700 [Aeromonas jandaei]|uniref:hypothetical protein n=1 Tax=Aeromonas jandaei TaxID=650 RepID=UPI000F534FAE|nr:hypothetical protein [Aeromonas jandaei]RQM76129.1 hypothetical protein EHZ47_08700 [Aeromonas jandaei]
MPPFHMFVKPTEDHVRPLFCIYLHSVTLMHILWCFIICNLFHLFTVTVTSPCLLSPPVTLQDFLSAFGSKLPLEPPQNGYMVNTTA